MQQDVKYLARMLGWKTYHTLRSEGSDPDFPDLVMARRRKFWVNGRPAKTREYQELNPIPRLIVAELKREGKNATPGQQEWLDFFKEIGAETYVWCPSDWETIQKVLK